VITCIGEKNPHGIREICTECGAEHFLAEKLITLTYAYGEPKKVYRELRSLDLGVEAEKAISELETITDALDSIGLCDRVRIDFSVVNDMNYYSGVVLRGFVDGIPEGILSGGRYDKLMEKMGRRVGAIGFAVYLDLLDRLDRKEKQYDADMVLLYDEDADAGELMRAVDLLTGSGKRVIAEKAIPTGIRYRQLLSFRNGGLEILETND
jgi:ATP phosphoribosyltransferase regulatory subunit